MKKIIFMAVFGMVIQYCSTNSKSNEAKISNICKTKMSISRVVKTLETEKYEEFSFVADGKYGGIATISKLWYGANSCTIRIGKELGE